VSVPFSRRSSVVLPEPFGPIRPTIDPRATDSETPSTTGLPPRYVNERSVASRNEARAGIGASFGV
jgi:hypothetical protein